MLLNTTPSVIEVLNQIKKGYINGQKTIYVCQYSVSLLRLLDFLCREGFIETFWREANGLLAIQLKYTGSAVKPVKFNFKAYSKEVCWDTSKFKCTYAHVNIVGSVFLFLDIHELVKDIPCLIKMPSCFLNSCRIDMLPPATFLRARRGNIANLIARTRQSNKLTFELCLRPRGVFCIQTPAGLINARQALEKGEKGPILFYFER